MSATTRQTFAFAPGVSLAVEGSDAVVSHFGREYGPAAVSSAPAPSLTVRFDESGRPKASGATGAPRREDRHRWLRWSVAIEGIATAIEARISLSGHPRPVVRSLVQGYVVEPLLSLVAPAAGQVLVPGAAIVAPEGTVLILGGSGAGKSSTSARAIAAGVPVLGDDQVLVDADGVCRPFPRRIRVYPDLAVTAPAAHANLPASAKARLAGHALLGTLTGGRLRPSLPLEHAALGPARRVSPRPLTRIVIVERDRSDDGRLRAEDVDVRHAVTVAQQLLERQRVRLLAVGSRELRDTIDRVVEDEATMLTAAFDGLDVLHLGVPGSWPAALAVETLAEVVGVRTSAAAALPTTFPAGEHAETPT